MLRTLLGDVAFAQGDYVFVPRGLLHRFLPERRRSTGSGSRSTGGLHVPEAVAQRGRPAPHGRAVLAPRLQAPAAARARRRGHPRARRAPRRHAGTASRSTDSPLDVVGWDGTVYPWAFPILAFQPRVSSVHLPPTWHGTFAARGALICSFVPRPARLPPRRDPVPVPAQLDALRRDHLLLRRQLHVAPRRRARQRSRITRWACRTARTPGATRSRSARRAPTSSRSWSTRSRRCTRPPRRSRVEDPGYQDSFL